MERRTRWQVIYRWATLALAVIVWVRCFGDARLDEFGWQFRLVEVWAVSASAISAALMVRLSMGWSASRHESFAGGVAAVNAVVVALHLGPLGLISSTPAWHVLGLTLIVPLLQIADALLVLRAFGHLRGAVAWVLGIALAYVAWVELAVRPLNLPVDGGGGLPYPALNALGAVDRLGVYGAATGLALAVLPGLWVVQRRLRLEAGSGGGLAV